MRDSDLELIRQQTIKDFVSDEPREVFYYPMTFKESFRLLYYPIFMRDQSWDVRGLLQETDQCRPLINAARGYVGHVRQGWDFKYIYLTFKRGWVSPEAPQNRGGWHCDGFGSDDMNFVWSDCVSTECSPGHYGDISTDHVESMEQFERHNELNPKNAWSVQPFVLHYFSPRCVHRAVKPTRGTMRTFIKLSFSDQPYNLDGNSINRQFKYDWPMAPRQTIRNHPYHAQRDFVSF